MYSSEGEISKLLVCLCPVNMHWVWSAMATVNEFTNVSLFVPTKTSFFMEFAKCFTVHLFTFISLASTFILLSN